MAVDGRTWRVCERKSIEGERQTAAEARCLEACGMDAERRAVKDPAADASRLTRLVSRWP